MAKSLFFSLRHTTFSLRNYISFTILITSSHLTAFRKTKPEKTLTFFHKAQPWLWTKPILKERLTLYRRTKACFAGFTIHLPQMHLYILCMKDWVIWLQSKHDYFHFAIMQLADPVFFHNFPLWFCINTNIDIVHPSEGDRFPKAFAKWNLVTEPNNHILKSCSWFACLLFLLTRKQG